MAPKQRTSLEVEFGRVHFQEFYTDVAPTSFPATDDRSNDSETKGETYNTLGKTRTQKTRDLPDQSLEESVVLLC